MIDKSNSKEFVIYNPGYCTSISVIITNGELVEVAHWGTKPECTHDLKKHPNWEHAEAMLESICKYNGEYFLSIVKILKKNSQGYAIIKKIVQRQIADCESRISKIKQELDLWNDILS